MQTGRQPRDVRFPTVSDRMAEFAGGPFGAKATDMWRLLRQVRNVGDLTS
jgi:hypothetical protein